MTKMYMTAAEASQEKIPSADEQVSRWNELQREIHAPIPSRIFRNKNFTKRDYECTNIVACLADKAPSEAWIETTHEELNAKLRSPVGLLYIQDGISYYGYL